jgi:spore germination protein GerM
MTVKILTDGPLSRTVSIRRRRSQIARRCFAVAVLIGTGLWLRTLQPLDLAASVGWPWTSTTVVTLYFLDGGSERTRPTDGPYLFPVSRRMSVDAELPRRTMEALLAGPPPDGRLSSAVPAGVALRSLTVMDGVARVDLSGAPQSVRDTPAAVTAIIATMTRLPGVTSVALSVDGMPLAKPAARAPLLYYPSAGGLVASPAPGTGPRAALDAYLAGPSSPDLTGFPADARLLGYEFDAAEGLVSLRFAYTQSVRTLALERPDRMRFLLLGLIATLTDYPDVRAVQLDFGGQSRLGLGECSDLLRTPQPRPALLNDERLLQWNGGLPPSRETRFGEPRRSLGGGGKASGYQTSQR